MGKLDQHLALLKHKLASIATNASTISESTLAATYPATSSIPTLSKTIDDTHLLTKNFSFNHLSIENSE